MADDADMSDVRMERELESMLRNRPSADIDYLAIGECDMCGEIGRLIEGECVPCRKLQEAREKQWKIK